MMQANATPNLYRNTGKWTQEVTYEIQLLLVQYKEHLHQLQAHYFSELSWQSFGGGGASVFGGIFPPPP